MKGRLGLLHRIRQGLNLTEKEMSSELGVSLKCFREVATQIHPDVYGDHFWWEVNGLISRRMGAMRAMQEELQLALDQDRAHRAVRLARMRALVGQEMTLVVGIDPGASGALAVYDPRERRLVGDIHDMPLWYEVVGRSQRKRKRIDLVGVSELANLFHMQGVEVVVMEQVGGRKAQNAAHAFTFGYGVGVLHAAMFDRGFAIEHVLPQTWKKMLNVPGKSKADDTAIVARADELFPHDRGQFRGPNGGLKVDRAEAAMIAKFGGDVLLPSLTATDGVKLKDLYRAVEVKL